jgi:hypothetical protein
MNYNLTERQRQLARNLVEAVRLGNLPETFDVIPAGGNAVHLPELKTVMKDGRMSQGADVVEKLGTFNALVEAKFLVHSDAGSGDIFTLTGSIYSAVDSDFTEQETTAPISTLAQPHPPEIAMSLDRLRTKYPDPKKLGFLVMRFTAAKPFARIVEIIKETAGKHGLAIVRADEQEFHADLWGNVRTYLHGCGFGIAVYERIETDEPNANVGLEVGYLLAMNKPVLLLKDRTLEAIQSDLAGKLYKNFDPHDPDGTIPELLNKWLEDNGIVVPKRA